MSPHADWHTDAFPEWRESPPWVMEEMIAAEPGLAAGIARETAAAAAIAGAVRAASDAGLPIVVAGCGTSEHGAHAVAAQLDEALGAAGSPPGRVAAAPAFEAALSPRPGLCIAVSHEGETAATMAALAAARHAGATTALITAVPRDAARALADHVLTTPLVDRSWCHTVGYMSPILAGAAVAAALRGEPFDARAVERHLDGGLADRRQAVGVAEGLAGVEWLIAAGSGLDAVAARELALKIVEGVRIPALAHELETVLHGHLVAAGERTGLVLFLTDPRARERRAGRGAQVLAAARHLGMRAAAIVTADVGEELPPELTPAGRIVVDEAGDLPAALSSLGASALALQELTVALVRRAGVNPDLIGREEARLREAAQAGEASFAG